jgi:branched-subunit amino acid aminotransferase/4-amino-4-deoxychorismate lyase
VFTTIGCDHGRPLLWEPHRMRLLSSLTAIGAEQVDLPTRDEICELLQVSNLTGPARLRIVARRVDGSAWTVEAYADSCTPVGPTAPPMRLKKEHWPSAPPLAGHKTLARLAWDLAREGAQRAGYDDALLLDAAGNVLETSVANVFVLKNGVARTPHAPKHCLPGVMRGWLLDHLGTAGVSTVAGDVAVADLTTADEIWLTNAVIGVRRVVAVDRREWIDWPCFSSLARVGIPAPGWRNGA